MFLENVCIYSHVIGLVTHMLDCHDLVSAGRASYRRFRSGYTECRLIKKWVYAVYLRIPSTTPLALMENNSGKLYFIQFIHWDQEEVDEIMLF